MPFSAGAFGDIGAGVSDLLAVSGYRSKAQGDFAEAGEYDLAAKYAEKEAQYTKMSTAIQEFQKERDLSKSLGQTTADVAGAGLATSGSAIDILRESASQGALAVAVLGQQGLIQEEGYEEQARSYEMMSAAATMAGNAEKKAAGFAEITGGIKIATGIASLLSGGGITDLLGGPGGAQLGGLVGMPEGEGGGFLGGFGGAG
jgi:hypothetical protein